MAAADRMDEAAFYSIAYPAPDGFAAATVKPKEAYFSKDLGEFLLPYEAMRNAQRSWPPR